MLVVQSQISELQIVDYSPIEVGTTGYALDYYMLTTFEPIKEKNRNIDVRSTFSVFDPVFVIFFMVTLMVIYLLTYLIRNRYLYYFRPDRKLLLRQDHYGYDIIRALFFAYDFNISLHSLRVLISSLIFALIFVNQVYNANFTTDRTRSQKPDVIDTIHELIDSNKFPTYTEVDGIENYLEFSQNPELIQLWTKHKTNNQFNPVILIDSTLFYKADRMIREQKAALLAPREGADNVIHVHCQTAISSGQKPNFHLSSDKITEFVFAVV